MLSNTGSDVLSVASQAELVQPIFIVDVRSPLKTFMMGPLEREGGGGRRM